MARRSKKIDFVHWTRFSGSSLAQSAATSVGVMVSAAQHLPETILRTRGSLLAFIDAQSAPGVLMRCAVGLVLVPEGTGSTVLWSPVTDGDAPWFYWSAFQLGYEEMVTDVISVQGIDSYREVIDSKAMRKSTQSTEIQVVFETVTLGSAAAVNFVVEGRILTGT